MLLIDDKVNSLELLSAALAQPGLKILTASDPELGLDLVYSKHPQIVLTDLVMPNLSGMEVLERIIEFDPSMEVILRSRRTTLPKPPSRQSRKALVCCI